MRALLGWASVKSPRSTARLITRTAPVVSQHGGSCPTRNWFSKLKSSPMHNPHRHVRKGMLVFEMDFLSPGCQYKHWLIQAGHLWHADLICSKYKGCLKVTVFLWQGWSTYFCSRHSFILIMVCKALVLCFSLTIISLLAHWELPPCLSSSPSRMQESRRILQHSNIFPLRRTRCNKLV